MIPGSWILGITLISFAFWLHWNDTRGWPHEEQDLKGKLASQYLSRRKRSRRRIHIIIAGCGAAIIVAALTGPGPIWIAAWMSVAMGLMTVVVLAGFDAFRTHRYQRTRLRQARHDLLGDDES